MGTERGAAAVGAGRVEEEEEEGAEVEAALEEAEEEEDEEAVEDKEEVEPFLCFEAADMLKFSALIYEP